jgi:hypothetical protein
VFVQLLESSGNCSVRITQQEYERDDIEIKIKREVVFDTTKEKRDTVRQNGVFFGHSMN